jgi:hypothetical protein
VLVQGFNPRLAASSADTPGRSVWLARAHSPPLRKTQLSVRRSMTGFRDDNYTLGEAPQLGHGFLLANGRVRLVVRSPSSYNARGGLARIEDTSRSPPPPHGVRPVALVPDCDEVYGTVEEFLNRSRQLEHLNKDQLCGRSEPRLVYFPKEVLGAIHGRDHWPYVDSASPHCKSPGSLTTIASVTAWTPLTRSAARSPVHWVAHHNS